MDQLNTLLVSFIDGLHESPVARQERSSHLLTISRQEQVRIRGINKHTPLFSVSGVEQASPANGWDQHNLDSQPRGSLATLGCWSPLAGSQDTPGARISVLC